MANAPWCATGYGTQTRAVVPRLKALGHEVAVFAFYGLQSGMLNIGGVSVYPLGLDAWGGDIVDAHMRHFKADVLITLMDVWVQDYFGRKAQEGGWAFCPWLPIDQAPVPERVLERLEGAHTVLPYSLFGKRELWAAGVQNLWYIPHGVDCEVFKPGDKLEARRLMGLPEDAFIIGMVAANKGFPARKCFVEQMTAFRQFKQRTGANAVMYLHTMKSTRQGGVDFAGLLKQLGLVEGEEVIFSGQYNLHLGWPEDRLATLYQALDVLSTASMGEGFGLPMVEAQACGTPVVTADNTTSTQLTFAGVMVEKTWPWWTPLNSWAYIPDVDALADAYQSLYEKMQDPTRVEELGETAREGALEYDWSAVMKDYWQPFLEWLEEDLGKAAEEQEHKRAGVAEGD